MALTDEGKIWISTQLNALFTALDGRIERVATALDAGIEKLDAKIERVETEFNAKIERVETSLLTEFHEWASPHDSRLRAHTAALRTFGLDLEALTERVKRLEDQRPH